MKPIPAIVEPAQIDVDLVAEQVIVALAEQRQAETSAARHEQQAAAARETARMRRIEIGKHLLRVRAAWPERGPNAKGWTAFLARVRLDDSTAHRYMQEARDPDGFSQRQRAVRENSGGDGPEPANVHGGSGEPTRGTYCTPAKYAAAVGPWDLDPFSNPRSHVESAIRCMLENDGDGLADLTLPGSWIAGGEPDMRCAPRPRISGVADENTRVWIQPPYGIVEAVIAHYGHTRFCALLRFAPDTAWFRALWPRVCVIAIPRERIPFEADGVEADGAPFPHVLYYADERDVTPAIRELCIVLRVEHPNT